MSKLIAVLVMSTIIAKLEAVEVYSISLNLLKSVHINFSFQSTDV